MSYANGTQFYNLPQTVGTDKRDWFDTNSAFAAIDAALHSAVTGQASDAEAIATINGKLATDEADIAALQTKGNTHDSQIAALQTTVNTQASQIQDVRQDAEDMITANNEGAAATSTRAYAIGDYFIYNDVLYKATAAIAIGDTIVPNTNCEATNVDTELTQVNSDMIEYDHSGNMNAKIIANNTLGGIVEFKQGNAIGHFKTYASGRVTVEQSTDNGTTWKEIIDSNKLCAFTPSAVTLTTDTNGNATLSNSSSTMIISARARGNYIVVVGNDAGTDNKFFKVFDVNMQPVASTSVTIDYIYVNY